MRNYIIEGILRRINIITVESFRDTGWAIFEFQENCGCSCDLHIQGWD